MVLEPLVSLKPGGELGTVDSINDSIWKDFGVSSRYHDFIQCSTENIIISLSPYVAGM
jgi:hypothetical protein